MKIGFSFGQCVRDLVQGVVQFDDVLFIISGTLIDKNGGTSLDSMVDAYLQRPGYLQGLDREACLRMARRLWDANLVFQPRAQGIQRFPVVDYVWADVFPTPREPNPALQAAWENYRTIVQLTNSPPDDKYVAAAWKNY